MSNVIEEFISISNVETHLKIAGQGSPLLYLHGLGLSNLWLPFHQALAEHYKVYAPDHPGFGLSSNPDWFDSMEDFIIHYVELLDVLNLSSINLVGHSLGGWIAAEIASFFPDRINKLVLIAAGGLRVAGSPITDIFALSPELLPMVCFEDPNKAMVIASQRDMSNIQKLILQDYRERTMAAKLAWKLGYNPKLARRLRRACMPTLIVWGKNDKIVSTAHAQQYCNLIPNAKLAIIDECGHVPIVEQSEQTTNLILEFLNQ